MMKKQWTTYGAVAALLAVTAFAGCSDTAIVGSTLDGELARGDEGIQLALARGSNSELTDVFTVDPGYKRVLLAGTDDIYDGGTATDEENSQIGNWEDSDIGIVNAWQQAFEGSWAGLKVVNNAITAFSEERFQTTPLVARGYLNSAHAEKLIGDFFCEAAYGFDHTGGLALDNLGDSEFDASPVGKDSVFRRMVTFAELALAQAERAVAAGEPNPANEGVLSDGHFEPERLVTAAHGALAQAYHALASLGVDPGMNWSLAVQHAAQVPTDFVEWTIQDPAVEDNEFWDQSWGNNGADTEITLYSAPSTELPQGFLGVPATFLWPDDPRVGFQDCTVDDRGCHTPFADGDDTPMWVPLKYPDEGSDDEMVTGTEMRLIEAEEALVNRGDLNGFYDKVDEARAFHGVGPTERPMVVGAFEWPNAEDDAMSILDRERYLDLHMEGRRLFDLYRWDHPFITGNHVLSPRHASELGGGTRMSCAPVAESECTLNPNFPCP